MVSGCVLLHEPFAKIHSLGLDSGIPLEGLGHETLQCSGSLLGHDAFGNPFYAEWLGSLVDETLILDRSFEEGYQRIVHRLGLEHALEV